MTKQDRPGQARPASADGAALVLLGRNLRCEDNAPLAEAAASGLPVIPLFILDEDGAERAPGGASQWWRWESLSALDAQLRTLGSRIVLRRGKSVAEIENVARVSGAKTLHLTWRTDPAGAELDRRIVDLCRAEGLRLTGHHANYLHDPAMLRTGAGEHFKVFTPFWRRLLGAYTPQAPCRAPVRIPSPPSWPQGLALSAIAVTDPWTRPLRQYWTPGREGAAAALNAFIGDVAARYAGTRDLPGIAGTSRLSPHLAWGEIGIHEVWRKLRGALGDAALPYLRQLGWRDFNMHLAAGFGSLSTRPMRSGFDRFPFVRDCRGLEAWRRGRTGYPIVDAGMRELWSSGWMHNRVRMITASFLVKDLLIDWRLGEAWFWDTLVDADAAQNPGNWQWVAGCGADAAPFFRIFNPVAQARRFDADGVYVRRWVPELSRLGDEHLHAPWEAPPVELEAAGIRLGRDYPMPIVDHARARRRALGAYRSLKEPVAGGVAGPAVGPR